MPTIYAYCRCSHEKSTKSGIGIDVQVDQCLNWAKLVMSTRLQGYTWGTQGWRGEKGVGGFTDDGFFIDQSVSALKQRFTMRPAGSKLHAILQPGDVVVIAKLDRGFRNSNDLSNTLLRWSEMGVSVSFLDIGLDTSTPIGKMVITIMGAVAQMDSDLKSERNKEVAARLKAEGKRAGGRRRRKGFTPKATNSGFKYEEPNNYELQEMHWVVALRDSGVSWSMIVEMLEEKRAKLEGRKRWPVAPYHGHKNRYWHMESARRAYDRVKAGKVPKPNLDRLTAAQKEMPSEKVKLCREPNFA